MKFLVVIEKGPKSFAAYAPDLPGCGAVAQTRDQVLELIREAIEAHLQALRQQNKVIPIPSAFTAIVDVK